MIGSRLVPSRVRKPIAAIRDEAVERVIRRSPIRIGFAVVYHSVAAETGDLDRELAPAHGRDLFDSQLRFLKSRYGPVPASTLLDAVRSRRPGEPIPVAITFDDDLRSHVEYATPALIQHELPAAFFLNGASLDRPNAYWWDRLQRAVDQGVPRLAETVGAPASSTRSIHRLGRHIETVDPQQRREISDRLAEVVGPDPAHEGLRGADVRKLKDAGFEIGFHTVGHDPLPALEDAALQEALTAGRSELGELAPEALKLIAYPHGLADGRVVATARASGYAVGFTTEEEPITPESHPLLLGRFTPSFNSVRHFASQITKILLRGVRHTSRGSS